MHKNMALLFFTLLLFSSYSYANFIIKLASYSQEKSVEQQTQRLDTTIQKNIMLIEEAHLYKLFSKSIQTKEEALSILPLYQKVFSDAYIMVDTYTKKEKKSIDLLLALQEESNTTTQMYQTIEPIKSVLQPYKDRSKTVSFLELLQNKVFYLCPEHITAASEKILIKAQFLDNNVSYTTLIGDTPHFEMRYMVKQNRLYMINHNRVSPSQFSTIDKIFFEYMVVARWMKGKKIHQMRYYKRESDARSYISSIHLN